MNILIIFGAKYFFLVAIVATVLYFFTQSREVKKKILILGLVSLPVIYVVAKLASLSHYNPRPFVVGNFTPLIPHADDNGFPSDHALILAAIASALYPFNKKIGLLLWLITLAVGLSRVYVGVHHLSDIFGSVIIAVLISSLARRLLNKRGMV